MRLPARFDRRTQLLWLLALLLAAFLAWLDWSTGEAGAGDVPHTSESQEAGQPSSSSQVEFEVTYGE